MHPLALPLMPLLAEGHAAERVLRGLIAEYQERFNLAEAFSATAAGSSWWEVSMLV